MTDKYLKAPKRKNAKFRFWLWPIRLLSKFWKSPVPPGLWLMNKFCQSILDINNDIPWMVHFTSRATGDIRIGKNVWKSFALSGGCYIQGINGVIIGDYTLFGPGVKIISANHDAKNLVSHTKTGSVVIGKHCWIGTNVTILPNVKIGDNVIVAANSVVNKNIVSNSIIGGVPAKQLKKINEQGTHNL